jgi:hypothetical protein
MAASAAKRLEWAPRALRAYIDSLSHIADEDPRPIVAGLRDSAAFAAMSVEMDTVVWTNGFDLAPEFLRANLRTHVPA